MQLADNVALAAALAAGQTINVDYTLRFDWARDGKYATDFADLSVNFCDGTLDAQFSGQYPPEFEVNDGAAQRRLTVHVTGHVNDVHVLKFFSPYSGYYGGNIGAVGTPCYYSIWVATADGGVEIEQFNGYLIQATPKRSDGTVELELADVTSQLTNGVTLMPSARSQVLAQWAQSGNDSIDSRVRQRGGNSLSWYLLHVCRASGLYQGPKPPKGCVAYWTLAGGVLPEIGGLEQMPRDGRQSWPVASGSWIMSALLQSLNELPRYVRSFGDRLPSGAEYPVGPWSPDIETPHVYPRYMWRRGQFGPEMRYDVYDSDVSSYGNTSDWMRMVGTTSEPVVINAYGDYRCRVGLGGWLRFDRNINSTNETSVTVMLAGFAAASEIDPNHDGSIDGPLGYVTFSVHPSTRAHNVYVSFQYPNQGVYQTWSCSWTPPLEDGVHYTAVNLDFGVSGAPTITTKLDGVTAARQWGSSGGTYPTSYSKYASVDGRNVETSGVRVFTTGGAQHWGVWQQSLVSASTPMEWSNSAACMDYLPQTDIGPSMARVLWTPDVQGKPAWDVIKAIGTADLGVVHTTEDGVLHYTNWEDIVRRRDTGETTTYLSLAEVDEVNPYTTFDSVANSITFTSQDKYAVDAAIFEASDPQQFQVASGRSARWQTTVNDAMSVMPGNVTPRRLAQGYWSTTAGSGDNPNDPNTGKPAYTWQDFMRAYAPEHWKNGFTAHNRGDVVGAGITYPGASPGQPAEGMGVFASAAAGWARGDRDPRHLTLGLSSGLPVGGRTSAASVDDNTAFFNVRGYKIAADQQVNDTVASTDTASFESFGVRNVSRPQSDWASDYSTQYDLTQKLADDLAQPRPVFTSVDVHGDPRRQLQDVVRIDDPGGIGGPIYATVVGINRKFDAQGGITDSLTLRTFGPRAGSWVIDDPNFSVMDETTLMN
ncbi:hypothetical protein [Sciscionella sediminilitoris]|uniref:hypothetical protein n=1 Tax=Sciscionella sediminilitoris TaxID=1445613 RepID=UPI0004DFC40F|nr:hypothetical protein [Sciscionella sp. SE31]